MSDAGPSIQNMLREAAVDLLPLAADGGAVSQTSGSEFSVWSIVLTLLLILVNAFFAAAEIAVISFNDNKLAAMAEDGNRKAKTLLKIVKEPSKFFATIQIGVTLSGLLASAFTADKFSGVLAAWVHGFWSALPLETLETLSLLLLTVILSFITLIFGELVPKRVATQNPEKLSLAFAGILGLIFKVFKPFVFVLAKVTNGVIRLFGIDPNAESGAVTEEEIRMMVDAGNEKGVIEESQREMINNIFEFDDISVGEVMTHRTEVAFVSISAPIDELLEVATKEGYSRIPVYNEDIDDVVGIVYVKDLLPFVTAKDTSHIQIKDLMRPVLFVPESNRCKELFKEFSEKRTQIAVVVDEYGGTAGIVTMEDLLESIVGNIQDEYDDEQEEICQTGEGLFELEGGASLEEVFEQLEKELPEETECDTVGGFVIDLLGRIPQEGETPEVEYNGLHFQVLEVEDRRIVRLRVEKLPEAPQAEEK